jgi:hypothetical protein
MGDVIHGNKYGGDHVEGDKIVNRWPAARPKSARRPVISHLCANSADRPLRIDIERREIAAAIAMAGARDRLDLRTVDAVRLSDLHDTLLDQEPAIVHFSGHGAASTGIMVTDESRRRDLGERPAGGTPTARTVSPGALTELFGILRKRLRCVVLNACYTEDQARAIAAQVPCVVGMRGGIQDDAAIGFATAFYRAIAYGETIETAFRLGRNQLRLGGHMDAGVPQLLGARRAAEIRIVRVDPARKI